MSNSKMVGKVLIAVLLSFCAIICSFMGFMALKKSMEIKVVVPLNPRIRCEIQIQRNGDAGFTEIFSNVEGAHYTAPNVKLNTQDNSLTLTENINCWIVASFNLKILNYTNSLITVSASGDGVNDTAVGIAPFVQGGTAPNGVINITTNTPEFNLEFNEVYEFVATLDDVELDTTYDNTLIVATNGCYVPKGENLIAKFKDAKGTNACPDILSLTINSVSQLSAMITNDWYNYSTQVLTLPSAQITGTINLNSSIYWDGTRATEFASGNGTTGSTFKIATAKQLALLSYANNNYGNDTTFEGYTGTTCGLTFCTAYYELTNNIYLNDEIFEFQASSGVVLVKDLNNNLKCCLGTGMVGTSVNTGLASVLGTIYSSTAAGGTLGGAIDFTTAGITVYEWEPIGFYDVDSVSQKFIGIFNGGNHFVSGIYENNSLGVGGVFGDAGIDLGGSVIKNLSNMNGYIKGDLFVGGIVGACSGIIDNCMNKSFVGARSHAGGIVGYNYKVLDNDCIQNCFNYGPIIGGAERAVGGIVGANACAVNNCFNWGYVTNICKSQIGGITGFNYTPLSSLNNCYNIGTLSGGYTICGDNYAGIINYCYGINGLDFCDLSSINGVVGTKHYCGTFANATAVLQNHAGNATAMQAPYTTYTLIQALNAWVSAQASTNYRTWVVDTTTGYPTFGDFWSA